MISTIIVPVILSSGVFKLFVHRAADGRLSTLNSGLCKRYGSSKDESIQKSITHNCLQAIVKQRCNNNSRMQRVRRNSATCNRK